jgi:hypothetical protein
MNKLTNINDNGARRPVMPEAAGQRRRVRAAKNVIRPIRVIGKTAILAIELVEIVGFGLALL